MIEFIVRGVHVKATQEQVRDRLKGVAPEPARALVVEVDGLTYPVKQAFAVAFDIDRADFISHQARSVFQRLGFPVQRV